MTFSIVIPCYNDRENVEALLASLRLPGEGWEVIVVDDCSPEGPPALLETLPARLIRVERQAGPAAARNRGVRESTGDVVVFCDADIILAGDALVRLRPYFEEEGERAVISSGLLVPHNPGFFPRYKYYQEVFWVRAHTDDYTNHFSTRMSAIRRDVFAETGGFDETITTAGVEDYEFGYRMRALTRSRLAPDIAFSHRHPPFAKQARLYFTRTADYVELMHRMRLTIGDVTTIGATSSEAATALLAFVSQVLLVSSLLVPVALLASAGFTVAYLVRIRGLIGLLFEKEGVLFAVRGVLAHYALCSAIVLGAFQGKLRSLRRICGYECGPVRRGPRMKLSWSLLAARAFVVWCFCFYVVVTLSSLDRRLQGDDHAVIWTSTSIRFGELPNRDFHDGGMPLQVLLSYLAQVATGHRPIGEIAVTVAMRFVGLVSLYFVARRITGHRLLALLIVLPVALISIRGGLYGAEKAMIYPLAAFVAYRYLERPGPPWKLCAVTALAGLLRHDHGVYIGLPLALAVVLSGRSLVPFVLGVIVLLLPWLAWVHVYEGVVTYFADRVEFAGLAGIAVARPGFGIPHGSPFEVRNASWIMWQLAVVTIIAAFAVAVRRRDRTFIVLSTLGGLATAGLMRGLGLYPEVAALWIPLGVWLVTLARRPVARVAAAGWVVLVAAFVLTISEPRERLWHYVLEEGGATGRAQKAIERHSTLPIIENYAPADVTDERLIVRYIYRCLDPGEHIWDAAQWFPLSYYTEHPLFDNPNWRLGIRRSHDAEMAAALRAGTLPPVIVIEDESDPYDAFKHYPVIQALVREKYEPLTSPTMDAFRKNIDDITLLRDRSRQPTGRYEPLDLPCFARAAAGATDIK